MGPIAVPANHGADRGRRQQGGRPAEQGHPPIPCNKLLFFAALWSAVQLEAAGGATEGGLIRPAFRVDVAAGRTHLAGVARVHRDHYPPPLLAHGFEYGLDLPQAGIPEAATEHGLRGSLIWAEGPWGHIGMDRHVVNMQHLRRNQYPIDLLRYSSKYQL